MYYLKTFWWQKPWEKGNSKIEILAGSTLMSRFHVGFEIALPLVHVYGDGVTVSVAGVLLVGVAWSFKCD